MSVCQESNPSHSGDKRGFHAYIIQVQVMQSIARAETESNPLPELIQEILALFVLCKFILQIRMRIHPAGLNVLV